MELENPARIRGEPEQRISRVGPRENSLAVCQLQRIGMQVTPDGDNAFGGCFLRIWETENRHTQCARLTRLHMSHVGGSHRCLLQTGACEREARFVGTVLRAGRVLCVRPAVFTGASEMRPFGKSIAMPLSISVNSSEHSWVRTIR